MNFGDYLKNHQPLVYRTFSNALKNGRLAHAYLLSGEVGAPLLDTAIYLSKSLLCLHPSPLADDTCSYCLRIDHRSYSGFRILGEEGTIKKEEIENLITDFSKSSLEEKEDFIYIINGVENMTLEAVNSLLKFLEEPPSHVHAFLLTNNITKVLPTIVSRCETLRLLLAPRNEVIKEALLSGAKKKDAELLSYFLNNGGEIPEYAKNEDYLALEEAFRGVLESLVRSSSSLYLTLEKDVLPLLDDKKKSRMFFDMLSLAFKDALAIREKALPLLTEYATLIEPLSTWHNLDKILLEIMKTRNLLELNINVGILLEHVAYFIKKENSL